MPGIRLTSSVVNRVVLLLIILGLVIGSTVSVRADTTDQDWSLREVVRTLEPTVVWVIANMGQNEWSQGSGFIVHEDGHILTNAHVVTGASEILVGWPDRFNRSEKTAEIVAADIELDLALIRVEGVHLPTIPIDTSGSASLGDAVITLAYPVGEELGLGGLTVTRGVLSCIRRSADGEVILLQTDAAVTLGCSGGPLYDLDTGSVIGIVQGKGMLLLEGFNFAIPITQLFEFSGTNPGDGVPAAIESLSGNHGAGFSEPGERARGVFEQGMVAREHMEWGEALSNFHAAWQLEAEDPQAAYGVAESYAGLDQPGQALRWLERAFELGYTDFDGALESDGFTEFRDDERFVDLVQSF